MKKATLFTLVSLFALPFASMLNAQNQNYNTRPVNVVYENPAPAVMPVNILLRAGTPVDLEIMNNLDGKYVNQGQTVDLRVKFDIVVNNRTVIAAGSVAKGIISRCQPGKGMGKAGFVEITPRNAQTSDGQYVPLAGFSHTFEEGGRHPLRVGETLYATVGATVEVE